MSKTEQHCKKLKKKKLLSFSFKYFRGFSPPFCFFFLHVGQFLKQSLAFTGHINLKISLKYNPGEKWETICLCMMQKEKMFGKKSRSPYKPGKDHLGRSTEVPGTPPLKACELCLMKWLLTYECLMWDLESWPPSLSGLVNAWGNLGYVSWLGKVLWGSTSQKQKRWEPAL